MKNYLQDTSLGKYLLTLVGCVAINGAVEAYGQQPADSVKVGSYKITAAQDTDFRKFQGVIDSKCKSISVGRASKYPYYMFYDDWVFGGYNTKNVKEADVEKHVVKADNNPKDGKMSENEFLEYTKDLTEELIKLESVTD